MQSVLARQKYWGCIDILISVQILIDINVVLNFVVIDYTTLIQ